MKQKLPVFLFISAVLKLVASQYDECYPGEFLTPSVNPCNTCEERGYCPQFGEPGCDCSPGLFRNSYGACVPPEGCDGPYNTNYNRKAYPAPAPRPVCGPNEEYTDCGTACPPTCENRFPVCNLQCVKGCFCRRGYVWKNGRCVPPQDCEVPRIPPPRQCGANEIFLDCGSSCPPTCQNTQRSCTLQCVRGCFCITGYVRKNGICVPPQACNGNSPSPSYPGSGPVVPRRYGPIAPSPPRPAPVAPYPSPPRPTPVGPVIVGPPVTAAPLPPKPENSRGCPNRNSCNRYCRNNGFVAGFCVGPRFMKCNCVR